MEQNIYLFSDAQFSRLCWILITFLAVYMVDVVINWGLNAKASETWISGTPVLNQMHFEDLEDTIAGTK